MSIEKNQIPQKSKKRKSASERWTIEQASRELADWKKSGLSMAEYCRRRGLEAKQLYNCRARLEKRTDKRQAKSKEAAVPKRETNTEQNSSKKKVRLVEAEIIVNDVPNYAARSAVDSQMGPILTLALCRPERIEIEVHRHVEASWLKELVKGISEHHQ